MNLGQMLEEMLNNKTITMDMTMGMDVNESRVLLRHIYTENVGGTHYLLLGDRHSRNNHNTTALQDSGEIILKLSREDARMMHDDFDEQYCDDDNDYCEEYMNFMYKTIRALKLQFGMSLGDYEYEER